MTILDKVRLKLGYRWTVSLTFLLTFSFFDLFINASYVYAIFGIDDAVLLAILLATTAASAGVSAYSAYAQGQAQARMSAYNVLINQQNADLAERKQEIQKIQTRIAEKRHREQTQRLLGIQRTLYGKAGVTMEGTPLLTMEDTIKEAELDALAIRYAGSIEEANILAQGAGYKQEARLAKMRGISARQAGTLGAGSQILTGIGQFASMAGADGQAVKWLYVG